MNAAHLHLMLNHLPVLAPLFALAIFALALRRRSDDLKRLALGIVVVAALIGIPAYVTGEPAEEQIEHLPGISHELVEEHEESAAVAFTLLFVLGVAAAVGQWRYRRWKSLPGWFTASVIAGLVVTLGLMFWTANLGGQIRHPEIRAGAAAVHDDDD